MAFVHLHNHTVFSMLDGATRIQDMVNRAVELGMPAVAITDHGYMYGVPDLALACDAVNHNTPEYKTWSHDKAFLEKDRRDELVEPDPEENPREHAQYVKDMAMSFTYWACSRGFSSGSGSTSSSRRSFSKKALS